MKKLILFLMTLFIAAILANYFNFISIPWLDLPQVERYTQSAEETDQMLKKLDE